MKHSKIRRGHLAFDIFNYAFLGLSALLCLLPIMNVLAVSFSDPAQAAAGRVTFLPVGFNTYSYKYALTKPQFLLSFWVSVKRVALAIVFNMAGTILAAYPLSKNPGEFTGRTVYAWFFFFTMIFSGGLIPTYMVVKNMGLFNSIWALILPGTVPVFNIIVLMNFFRQLPRELSESAMVDGAGHFTILPRIYLPLSKPSLATLVLFTIVGHWNEWFAGLIYMADPAKYPLQTYLRSVIAVRDMSTLVTANKETLEMLTKVSDRTLKSSQIFIASLPVLLIYPFLQKYFMKGLVLGSVKG